MTQPTILVTGATGKIGGATIRELLAGGSRVRALVHRKDLRSEALHRLGVEVVLSDLTDAEGMTRALQGVQRVCFIPPLSAQILSSAATLAATARRAGVESIVGLSQWLASPSHPSVFTRQHWLADRLLGELPGIAYTVVNPGFFADNYLRTIPIAAQLGLFPWIYGESRDAPPSNEDIARVCAAAVRDPKRHAGKTYRPTGPRLLTKEEMVGAIGTALKRRVFAAPMPLWLFSRAARLEGATIEEMAGYRYYLKDLAMGAFEHGAPNDVVQEVTGRKPEDFQTLAHRYAALPSAERGVGRALAQWAKFLITPVTPAFDLSAYDRGLRDVLPARPELAMQSRRWAQQRSIQ